MDYLASSVKQLLNLDLTSAQLNSFRLYAEELAAWNEKFNLTAIKEPKDVEIKHFADSLSCLLALRPNLQPHSASLQGQASPISNLRVIDIGTGAGFPGVPLKIVCPDMKVTLVESVGKKVKFLNHIIEKLELKNVVVIQSRAEEIGQKAEHRERYDWAVARAVAVMPILLEYLLPLVKVGGKVLAQKGESAPAEAQGKDAEKAARILGGTLDQIKQVELPTIVEPRYLVIFNKTAATPNKYPRRAGTPAKESIK
ncbi:MAG: 16S rRNA (guanine(527)-N(7))-methyltransferase RsmG [Chloroflexi bacterium]|nr:16S rRNA (guanine(527)-N(7))-methyltransferase RsmG [Chloroflexota bacterium]